MPTSRPTTQGQDWLSRLVAGWRQDVPAGLTVGAMMVPQAMAYAVLAGLPPEVGLYAATVPLLAYALLGTSRQLSVGPVAIVSLLAASALAPIAAEGTEKYLAAAAALAVVVGGIHLLLGFGRLGFLVDLLSNAVLVGFTAAAAMIIGLSQVKHLLGVTIEQSDNAYGTAVNVVGAAGGTNTATLVVGVVAMLCLVGLKHYLPRVPAAVVVVIGSIIAVRLFGLESDGVRVIGSIPTDLPRLAVPALDASLWSGLVPTALVITAVGFMQSVAAAKTFARRHHYEIDANRELIGLGTANVAAGLFGGYPVTGGFSRTAVNDSAGAVTKLASVVSALVVLVTIALLTPLLASLPNAVLAAIIISAVAGLIDIKQMLHIAAVKPTDMISLSVAFFATLILGVEIGMAVAVVVSMLVVFARMSVPHRAVLGRVPATTSYRNVDRFPEAEIVTGVRIVRIDAAVSFVNAANIRRLILDNAAATSERPRALILDASGINDLDATGAEMLDTVLDDVAKMGVQLHISDVKGPVRDVLHRAGVWQRLDDRIHPSTHGAVTAIEANIPGPADRRRFGVDERPSCVAADLNPTAMEPT